MCWGLTYWAWWWRVGVWVYFVKVLFSPVSSSFSFSPSSISLFFRLLHIRFLQPAHCPYLNIMLWICKSNKMIQFQLKTFELYKYFHWPSLKDCVHWLNFLFSTKLSFSFSQVYPSSLNIYVSFPCEIFNASFLFPRIVLHSWTVALFLFNGSSLIWFNFWECD